MDESKRFEELIKGQEDAAGVAKATEIVDSTRMGLLEQRLAKVEYSMGFNTSVTLEIKGVLDQVKAGLKVLGVVGIVVRWFGMIAGGLLAMYGVIWTLMHGGVPPK